MQGMPDPTQVNAVICTSGVQSLIGAALLRISWADDPLLLQEACLVVRAG